MNEENKKVSAFNIVYMIKNLFNPEGYSMEEIEDFSKGFSVLLFIVSALYFILSFFFNMFFIWDAVLTAILGFMVLKVRSRFLSFVILLYSILILLMAIQIKTENLTSQSTNIFLTGIFWVLSLIYMRSIFCYHKIIKSKIRFKNIFIKTAVAIIYFFLLFFGFAFLYSRLPILYFHQTASALIVLAVPLLAFTLAFKGIFPNGKNCVIVYQEDH